MSAGDAALGRAGSGGRPASSRRQACDLAAEDLLGFFGLAAEPAVEHGVDHLDRARHLALLVDLEAGPPLGVDREENDPPRRRAVGA